MDCMLCSCHLEQQPGRPSGPMQVVIVERSAARVCCCQGNMARCPEDSDFWRPALLAGIGRACTAICGKDKLCYAAGRGQDIPRSRKIVAFP